MHSNIDDSVHAFKRVILNCLAPQKKERILIIGDHGTAESQLSSTITKKYASACRQLGLNYEVIFQKARIKGEKADEKIIRRLKELPEGSIIILNVSIFVGTLASVGLSFRKFCHFNNHRFISSSGLIGIKDKEINIFTKSLDIDYKALDKRGTLLKEQLDKAKTVKITTPAGTDITLNITDMVAINNAGNYTQQATGGNVPAGEVYIPPKTVDAKGKIVVDGSIRTRKGTVLVKNKPVILTVEEGSVINIEGGKEAKQLQETIKWAQNRAKYPDRVTKICEFGLGTNPGASFVGATIIDEKILGTCHLALGSNSWFGGTNYSIVHLDHVLKDPTVYLDGKKLLLPQDES